MAKTNPQLSHRLQACHHFRRCVSSLPLTSTLSSFPSNNLQTSTPSSTSPTVRNTSLPLPPSPPPRSPNNTHSNPLHHPHHLHHPHRHTNRRRIPRRRPHHPRNRLPHGRIHVPDPHFRAKRAINRRDLERRCQSLLRRHRAGPAELRHALRPQHESGAQQVRPSRTRTRTRKHVLC